ncbi:MAG: nicotinate-nucleotide adenylyltransferase [Smithella sp.]|jgi:nicotinate-nucleotide adenylyltransferase
MKWGLFGGTFDPIHFGHLRAAQELIELVNLDRVVFIPAFLPPHKTDRVISSFEHRLQMVRLAVSDNERFAFSDVENQRPGKSYSIDTVRYFLNSHDENLELYFITGQDAFDAITTWHQWDELLSLCHFVVMTRPGYENRGLAHILPEDIAASYVYNDLNDCFLGPQESRIYFRKTTFLDISSSAIRQSIQQVLSVQYLVPDQVIRFINEKRLYR